eukprot:4819127-Amphidinium_carterae.1
MRRSSCAASTVTSGTHSSCQPSCHQTSMTTCWPTTTSRPRVNILHQWIPATYEHFGRIPNDQAEPHGSSRSARTYSRTTQRPCIHAETSSSTSTSTSMANKTGLNHQTVHAPKLEKRRHDCAHVDQHQIVCLVQVHLAHVTASQRQHRHPVQAHHLMGVVVNPYRPRAPHMRNPLGSSAHHYGFL